MKVSTNRKSGFTLVEIMIVVAIIGLLAALLLPTLTRTKNKSKSAKCLAHMRQIATASHLYADEHGDAFALLVRNGRTNSLGLYSNSGFTWWTTQLKPYVANTRVYKCPSQKTDYGIGMNHSEIGLWNSGRTLLTEVAHPDATAVFADCGTGSFINTNTFTSTNSLGIVTGGLWSVSASGQFDREGFPQDRRAQHHQSVELVADEIFKIRERHGE